eukprot:GHVP01050739.1.p1 GENE.GHVP01050739.1~~GHVP01050739.1.p1  ORF type:complete len:201 (+),score=17.03 GHVP01050739.1:42-644(+)
MEFKLLSDQLNSAFEDVTTLQGNVYTLQDEVMPSEPAFSGIQRIFPKFSVWNGKIQSYVYTRINKSVKEKMKNISNILSSLPRYGYSSIRFDDGPEVEYLGMANPEELGFWKIKMCNCGNFKDRQMKQNTCTCPEFSYMVPTLHDGLVLEDCFSDCPYRCDSPYNPESSVEEEEDDGQAATITSTAHPFQTWPKFFKTYA